MCILAALFSLWAPAAVDASPIDTVDVPVPTTSCARTLRRRRGQARAAYWIESYCRPRRPADVWSLGATAAVVPATVWMLTDGERAKDASDLVEIALPAVAGAVPLVRGDLPGAWRFAQNIGLPLGIVQLLKEAVSKPRPNGTNDRSFPSGHTAAAFAAASFLHAYGGPEAGVPAYGVAVATALARVRADRHFLDDVIAGAGIALLSHWALESLHGRGARTRCPRWRIQFDFGAVWQDENEIEVPAHAGSTFDLGTLGGWNDLLPTAGTSVTHFVDRRRTDLMISIRPIEFRGSSVLPSDLRFHGSTFRAGELVAAQWRGEEYRFVVRRELARNPRRLSIRAGVVLALQDYRVRISSPRITQEVGSPMLAVLPHAQILVPLARKLAARGAVTGLPAIGHGGFDAEAAVRWRFAPGWDAELSYRWAVRPLGELDNDPVNQGVLVSFGRSF